MMYIKVWDLRLGSLIAWTSYDDETFALEEWRDILQLIDDGELITATLYRMEALEVM